MPADDKTLREAQMQVSRAKIAMFQRHPFYAHILTRLTFEYQENPRGAISATDGTHIFIDPAKYITLPKGEQVTCLAHEQLHCLDGHLWRRGQRDPFIANVAQDIYIYWLLRDEGFDTLTDNEQALSNLIAPYQLFDFRGMFWEQIYEQLAQPSQQQQSDDDDAGDGSGSAAARGLDPGEANGATGGCYHPLPAQGAATEETKADWRQWTIDAGAYAKQAGAQAGRWEELVKAATPKVSLETHLYEFLKRGLGGDQTYDAFSRRHMSRGEYMPIDVVEAMGETVIALDTSGSVSGGDLAKALGIVCAWRELHPCRLHIVECDTECVWHTFEDYESVPTELKLHGRGGTSFAPPFAEAVAKQLDPALFIYITDGYGYEYAPKPTYPVLWVLNGDCDRTFKPPYGEVHSMGGQ